MNITAMVGGFVALAITLGVTVLILGNTNSALECGGIKFANGTNNTGWQTACSNAQTGMQNSFNLLIVSLIITAAVVILLIVRSL